MVIEPRKLGAEVLAESQARREDSRIIEDKADEAFGLFTRYLVSNHWADKARNVLKGAAA